MRSCDALASAARRWLSSSAASSGAACNCTQHGNKATARRRGIRACIDWGSLQTKVKLERETLSSRSTIHGNPDIRSHFPPTKVVSFIELGQKPPDSAPYHCPQSQRTHVWMEFHTMRKTLFTASLLAAALAAPLAQAHQAGDIIVRAGAITVDPREDSGAISTAVTGSLAGSSATLDSDTQLGLNFAYMVTDNIGIELLAATPFSHDV